MRIVVTYDQYKARATRKLRCRGCSKLMTRSRTFSKTVNPFNKHADGTPKSPAEVQADVDAEAKAWQPERPTCADCQARHG